MSGGKSLNRISNPSAPISDTNFSEAASKYQFHTFGPKPQAYDNYNPQNNNNVQRQLNIQPPQRSTLIQRFEQEYSYFLVLVLKNIR